jgi:hypothetical protein
MQVNPAKAAAIEVGSVQEVQHLMVFRQSSFGQRCQETQDLLAPPEIPTSQLTQHERVA